MSQTITKLIVVFLFFDNGTKDDFWVLDKSDYIEVNHCYRKEDDGNLQKYMIQVIWWEWKYPMLIPEKDLEGNFTGDWYRGGAFVVKDFRVTHTSNKLNRIRLIRPTRENGKWVCRFYDKDDKCYRKVTSNSIVESHTAFDKEIKDREILKKEFRNEFTPPRTIPN